MDALSSDENPPFLRMEDFQQFPGYGLPQPIPPVTPMPWESYGIMMDPFSGPVMKPVPVYVPPPEMEVKPSLAVERLPQIAAPLQSVITAAAPQGPDAIRSKFRDSMAEALRMVAGEQSKEKVGSFLCDIEACKMNLDAEISVTMVDEVGGGMFPHAKRSKLQVFGGKGSDSISPYKKMRLDSDEMGFGFEERVAEHAKQVSKNIELELLRIFRAVDKKYKEKARSLVFNLKDKNNPELRARVFIGEVSPERLCSMTIEQLASKELSQWRMAKAEERAQMVVITDEDVNPSKIVKKTHKGEIIMEVEADAPEAPAKESAQGGASEDQEQNGERPEEESQDTKADTDPETLKGDADKVQAEDTPIAPKAVDAIEKSPSPSDGGAAVEAAEGENFEESNDPLLDVSDLPEIMSMDGFLKSLGCTDGEGVSAEEETAKNAAAMIDGKKDEGGDTEMTDAKAGPDDKADDSAKPNPLKRKLIEIEQKLLGSPSRKQSPQSSTKPKAQNGEEISNTRQQALVQLWEGSLQLTGTRSTAVHGVFRSGRDMKLDSWPKQLEVKGRVKLGPLAKFLKDLCNSKSRAVTVMSFYSSDMATSSLSLLKEVADQYEKLERVGFVEPGTGYELYLFPPGKATWKFLSENGRLKASGDLPKDKTEVLVGCVVWRVKPSDKGSSESKKSSSSAEKSKRTSSSSSKTPSSKQPRSKHSSSSASAPANTSASLASAKPPSPPPPPPPLKSAPPSSSSLAQQSQSFVVKHSVNEWHQSSLCSPTLSPVTATVAPPADFAMTFLQLSQALGTLLPGAKLPGYDAPPGFWHSSSKDGNDLPEFDYEGHIPMSLAAAAAAAATGAAPSMGVGYSSIGFQQAQGQGQGQHHGHGFLPPAEVPYGAEAPFVLPPAPGTSEWSRTGGIHHQVVGAQQQYHHQHHHQHHRVAQQQQQHQVARSPQQQQIESGSSGFQSFAPPPPPLPPPPPPAAAAAAANTAYGHWIHPNQAAQQKSFHYRKASVPAPSQRRHRS